MRKTESNNGRSKLKTYLLLTALPAYPAFIRLSFALDRPLLVAGMWLTVTAVGLASAILIASFIVARQKPDTEKVSPYECGFAPFNDARRQFDVRFYLVAILFIIFDLEVAFLFPWAVSLGAIGMLGFWSMILFLGILTIGFIYEWKKGALEWE